MNKSKVVTPENYLTVKDFAAEAGVTFQSVYQKIRTKQAFQNKYVKNIDGVTMISKAALWEVYRKEPPKQKPNAESLDQDQEEAATEPEGDPQKELVTILREQLAIKDKQITEQQEHIQQLTEALKAQQILTGHANNRIAQLEAAEHSGSITEPGTEEKKATGTAADSKPQNKTNDSFILRFKRLFHST